MSTAIDETPRQHAESGLDHAEKAAREAREALREAVRDGAYAYLGAGDLVADLVRELPERAEHLREQARSAADREALRKRLEELRGDAEREFDVLAARGRTVVDELREQDATKKALARTELARRQMQAASLSVRNAVKAVVDGAGSAAGSLGLRR